MCVLLQHTHWHSFTMHFFTEKVQFFRYFNMPCMDYYCFWNVTISTFCGLKQKPIPVLLFLFLLQLPFSLVLKTVDTEVVVVVRIWNKRQNFSPFYIKNYYFELIYFLIYICFSMHTSCFVACVSLPFVMVREQCCHSLSSLSLILNWLAKYFGIIPGSLARLKSTGLPELYKDAKLHN